MAEGKIRPTLCARKDLSGGREGWRYLAGIPMKKSGHRGPPLSYAWKILRLEPFLSPVVIVISVVIAVLIATVVVVPVPHFVAVLVTLVAIAVSISIPSYLPAAVPPPIISVVVVSPAVVGIVIISYVVAETRVISKACFVLASPLPKFPLTLAVQPVVLDIVVAAFSQPLPIVRIVVSVVAARAVIGIVS